MIITINKLKINNTTKEIKTFMNYAALGIENFNTAETLLDSASVKDGYILAEIQKYEAGNLDGATTWVVLDESLNIVKELPTIIADQFTYPSFMSADVMIVSARTVGNKVVYYGADVKSGKITLLPGSNELQDVTVINNGYFWNKKIYDKNWKLMYDFNPDYSTTSYSVYSNFHVVNGDIYCYSYYYSPSMTEQPTTWNIYRFRITANEYTNTDWVFDEELGYQVPVYNTYYSYSCDYSVILYNAKYYGDGFSGLLTANMYEYYYVEGKYDKYYNINGEYIFGEYANIEYVYDELLETGASYKVVTRIYNIEEIDGGYLVCMSNAYTINNTYDSVNSEFPEFYTEYSHYIVK